MSVSSEQLLHFCVNAVGLGLSAVTHEADSCLSVVVLLGPVNDSVLHTLEIIIACEERLAENYLFKGVGIACNSVNDLVILDTVHQVCGLDNKVFYAVVNSSFESLVDVIDVDTVTALNVVDDDVCCKTTAHRVFRESLVESALDSADSQAAAVVEAGSEAEHQQLIVADIVLISDIV